MKTSWWHQNQTKTSGMTSGMMESRSLPKSESLDELCEIMVIDVRGLKETFAAYNENCKKGVYPEFGKKDPAALAEDGIYYIIEQKPRFFTTLGGLKANENMEILTVDGNPIPNLHGAVSVVGGANGKDSMIAMMNSWSIGSGRIGDESAAENAGFRCRE
jgi:fumarate reductase flavoprotein subunit